MKFWPKEPFLFVPPHTDPADMTATGPTSMSAPVTENVTDGRHPSLRSSLRRDSSGASSLSLKTGSLSGWDAIRASLSSQNNRSRRGGLPRKHKSSKRLRESSTKAVKDARGGAAVKSRSSLGFSASAIYFLVLERTWWYCALVIAGVFALSLGVCALLCMAVGGFHDPLDSTATAPLRFAASHVLTMSFGTVTPVTDASYALAVTQCFLGVLLNVFMFTFVITKFQRPLAHMLLADSACLCTRAGEPFILVRIGNLRCNTLHRAEVTLTLLRRKRTPEGETFVSRTTLSLQEPPRTLTAVATVAHKILPQGPGGVFMDLATGRKTSEELKDLLLQCIVTAYDPIYDAEVCAVKVYGAHDFARGCVYADVMSIDEKGEAVVDFERIHDVLPQKIKIFPPLKDSWEGPDMNRPARMLEVVFGGGRACYGSKDETFPTLGPLTAMEQTCSYCYKLALLLNEAGMDYIPYIANISLGDDKPDWLEACNPKKETPVVRLQGRTEWIAGSDVIISTLAEMDERVRAVVERRREDVNEGHEQVVKKALMSVLGGVMFGPTVGLKRAVKIGGVGVMLLKMVGLVTPVIEKEVEEEMKKQMEQKEAESEASSDDIVVDVDNVDEGLNVRSLVQTCVSEAFDTIERLTAPSHGDEGRMFLCGKAPGVMDFGAAVDLANFFQPSFEVFLAKHDIRFRVGPNCRAWHARMTSLPHWRSGMGAGHSDGRAAAMKTIITKLVLWSKDPGYPERAASEELLRSTMRDFPPAYIEDTGKEELRSDDVDVVNVGTGLDFATAKLCV